MTLPSGEQIAYWTHHDDKKQTLVLVHGITGSHLGFQYLVPLLTDFRLIIPDLPGFGVSPLPHDKLTLAELGELLIDFIEELDLKSPPHLLGHSMGSLVVAEAIRQQTAIADKKLILVSPVPSPVGMTDSRSAGMLVSTLYYAASHRLPVIGKKLSTSRKITRLSTKMIMTAKDKDLQEAIHNHHFENLRYISSIGWYKRLYSQINRTGISKYKAALKPFDILMINGNKDKVTPISHQKKIAKSIDAKLVVIPGVGHLAHYEKPTELAASISDFLK
ncbi:MAG: hydrolase [Candidatus Saccharibacteria bacterium]|nr:hydrolase [Candidatus Saccharibacteria bacterium]